MLYLLLQRYVIVFFIRNSGVFREIDCGTSSCKRGVGWSYLGNVGRGRGGFTLGLGVNGLKGRF